MKQELERLFWILGAVLILPFLIQQGIGLSSDDGKPAVAELRSIPVMQPAVATSLASPRQAAPEVQTLGLTWEQTERPSVAQWAGQVDPLEQAVGTLFIPVLGLQVPVFADSDEITLALGASIIPGSNLHEAGSVGLASHPDGHFRHLKSVVTGDLLLLKTKAGLRHFQVVETRIMAPEDSWTPAVGDNAGLTLVTCYPSSFEGAPPQRFVVSAREVSAGNTATPAVLRQVARMQPLATALQDFDPSFGDAPLQRFKF